jgi:thiol-disulfide isomerase/thioredoxin
MYDAPRFLRWVEPPSILLLGLALSVLAGAALAESANLDDFARCLTKKGVSMYGASWCPICRAQLETFGAAAQHLSYVECSAAGTPIQTPECDDAGITGYPTWRFKNGSLLRGKVSLNELSRRAGCSLAGAATARPRGSAVGANREEGGTPAVEEEVLHLRRLDK